MYFIIKASWIFCFYKLCSFRLHTLAPSCYITFQSAEEPTVVQTPAVMNTSNPTWGFEYIVKISKEVLENQVRLLYNLLSVKFGLGFHSEIYQIEVHILSFVACNYRHSTLYILPEMLSEES